MNSSNNFSCGFTQHSTAGRQLSAGFTLIELLVVIAIIGLLSSAVLASVNSARDSARVTRAVSDLRQINVTLSFYLDDNDGMYPCFDHDWADIEENAWSAPYLSKWPTQPWGNTYQWEHQQLGFTYSISIPALGQENADALEALMDDGNSGTGVLRGDGARLEYGGMDQSVPYVHTHC